MQPNPYDDLIRRVDAEQEQATQLRASMLGAIDANPDEEAELRHLAQRYGLPVDGVRFTLPETRARARFDAVDYDTLARELPATSGVVADPELARLAHDDVDNMGQIERKLRQLGGGFQEAVGMAIHGTGALLGVAQRAATNAAAALLPAPRPGPGAAGPLPGPTRESLAGPSDISEGWLELGGSVKDYARNQTMVPQRAQTFSDQVAGGLGQLAGQVAMFATGGAAAGTAGLYAQGASSMSDKIAGDTQATQAEKDLAVTLGAAVTRVTEKWALDKVLGPVAEPLKNTVTAGLARIGIAAVSEGGQELAESVLQDVVRQQLTNPDVEIELGQALQEGSVGAVVGGLARSLVEAALHVRTRGTHRQQQAAQAEETAGTLAELNQAASQSRLLPRDAQIFEQFADHAAEGGQLFIDARALLQSGLAEPLAAASPSVAAQLDAAAATGGAIAIPGAEYTARIAPTDLAPALLEHLRTDPEGLSLAEARASQAAEPEQLQQDFEQAAAQVQQEAERQHGMLAVRQQVQAELDATGRFTPQANEAYAALTAAYYARRAEMLGITPEELYQRQQLHVAAQGVLDASHYQQHMNIIDLPNQGREAIHAFAERAAQALQEAGYDVSVTRSGSIAGPSVYLDLRDLQLGGMPIAQQVRISGHSKGARNAVHVLDIGSEEDLQALIQDLSRHRTPERLARMQELQAQAERQKVEKEAEHALWLRQQIDKEANALARADAKAETGEKLSRMEARAVQAREEGRLIRDGGKVYFQGEAPRAAGQAETQRQFQDTERAYGGRVAYEQARAAGQTKLDYRQWVQVRTPAFKAWFGDWEARRGAAKLRKLEPLLLDDVPLLADKKAVEEAFRAFNPAATVNREDGRAVTFPVSMAGKVNRHKGFDMRRIAAAFDRLYAQAVPMFSEVETLREGHKDHRRNIVAYRHYAGKFSQHGKTYYVRFTTHEMRVKPGKPGFSLAHSAFVSDVAIYKEEGAETGTASFREMDPGLAEESAPADKRLAQWFRAGKSDSISKTIDTATGEPQAAALGDASANSNILHQGTNAARGYFNPETLQIALLKNADLSTWLHESGHFFFENDIALASQILAMQREGASITEGEQQLLQEVSALLAWHGLQGGIDEQLSTWHGMGLDERRAHHERIAESFERYLMEGNAPSLELAPYFRKFRAWLLSVYQSIKDFLARHPEAGKLSPEVRRIFDRMLASDEQIRLAQQSRSMAALFASPEEAGMTAEAFAAYQAQGEAAAASAAEQLQARALRDLQWVRNAHARELRKLQAQAHEMRQAAKVDVMQQMQQEPLWRAWRFLTNRISEEDKLPPLPGKPKATAGLAPEHDSLLTAIAKMGGINRESAREHLGVNKDDYRVKSGVFGKPVFRKTGGLPADLMAEQLADQGYLRRTEEGGVDLHDLEDRVALELSGTPQYSIAHDWEQATQGEMRAGDQAHDLQALGAGRLDLVELKAMAELPAEVLLSLQKRGMTSARGGLHPDIMAELFGFTSGDELVRALAAAPDIHEEVEDRVDAWLLQEHGELATPEALEREADRAIQNEARARMVATEANALARAMGQRKVASEQARALAEAQIARVQVRHLRPGLYGNLQARAARAAQAAVRAGDLATAGAEKRNELVQTWAARAAHEARAEIDRGLRYLRKFEGAAQGLDADYREQIDTLLERFDLRKSLSSKAIDKRASLLAWVAQQREAGLEPDISADLLDEARRQSYKTMTVEQFRGLVDTVRQIEHLGRLKRRLLTDRQQREYAAIRDSIADSINEHAHGRVADTRTATTTAGRALQSLKRFGAAHVKAATWARVMDGGKDGGPVWEHIIRTANERADMESTMRADATQQLAALLAPLRKLGPMGGKGIYFPTLGRSLNRENRLAIALNTGNASNLQRLLGGEGWTQQQIAPVLQSLTSAEWQAVQGIWDHFESYRPLIGAKEKRIYGKEPEWVQATPLQVVTADGLTLQLRGGYYPVQYDPAASQRAEEHGDAEAARRQLQGAYTSATTRRSFTKARAEEVKGRPLLYALTGVYSGVNDVIHDLAWHEWLIDTNRLLRSHRIDEAMRSHWGPQAKQQFKSWVQDIAEGDKGAQSAVDMALGRLRQGVSVAGLGFNVISAAMQPLGLTQSIVRIGAGWTGRGIARYIARPFGLTREINEKSAFMRNRSRTRFRELNELRNMVQDQSGWREIMGRYAYWMMMRVQQAVDVPTWQGAYEKAVAEGNDEERAIALADQAVIDSQGGGETKDLSAIERGGPAQRLFTVYYSFMNTALNMGVAQTMSAYTPRQKAKLAADILLLYTIPAVLGAALKDALVPGGDDEDDETLVRKLVAEQISYLLGLMVVAREFSEAGKMLAGAQGPRDYSGPSGVRVVSDALRLGQQASQGEFDDAFRKAAINLLGSAFGLPSAQINRTWTGAQALLEGETDNPAALAMGYQR